MDYKSLDVTCILNKVKKMEKNKTALVTGSTSDIGIEICRILLIKGYTLINIDRDNKRALQVKKKLKNEFPNSHIENYTANLAESEDIKIVANKINIQHKKLNVIFHNAGILTATKILNSSGIELHFAVNCLAPYLLTKHLMPLLHHANAAKVIVSGSGASNMARVINVDQLINPDKFKAMSGSYAQSKASVKILFSYLQQQNKNIEYSVVDLPPTKTKMAKSPAMPTFLKYFSFLFSSPKKSADKLYHSINSFSRIKINKSQQDITNQLVQLVDKIQ